MIREWWRKLTLRCAHCGHRFRWNRDPRHSFGDNRGVYHGPCQWYIVWRRKAEERLRVIDVLSDLSGLSGRTIKGVVEVSAADDAERLILSNEAFRVFDDLYLLRLSKGSTNA